MSNSSGSLKEFYHEIFRPLLFHDITNHSHDAPELNHPVFLQMASNINIRNSRRIRLNFSEPTRLFVESQPWLGLARLFLYTKRIILIVFEIDSTVFSTMTAWSWYREVWPSGVIDTSQFDCAMYLTPMSLISLSLSHRMSSFINLPPIPPAWSLSSYPLLIWWCTWGQFDVQSRMFCS